MAKQSDKQHEETEQALIRQQQHTGNHDKPPAERGASDIRGGTRAGAENVEPEDDRGFKRVDEKAQAEAAHDRARQKGYD